MADDRSGQLDISGSLGRIVSRDGTILAFRRSGTGAPLVLVHGTASDSSRWRSLLPFLEPYFTVYTLDRRGYGQSGDSSDYRIEDEFDDLWALSAMIGDDGVRFVGHSFGALCVLGAACRAGIASRIVLYEPPLPAQPGAYFPPDLITSMRAALACGDAPASVTAFLANVFGMAPDEILAFRRTGLWTRFVERAENILRELEAVLALEASPDAFASCDAQALLILGGQSGPQYRETAKLLHHLLPSSHVVVLPDQGHGAIDAAPALFAQEVIAFLSEA